MEQTTYKKNVNKIFTKGNILLYLMILPPLVLGYIFRYIPMPGVIMAFQHYTIAGFRNWVAFDNFTEIFNTYYFWEAFKNSWVFVLFEYVFLVPAPIIFALLLNELRIKWYKRSVQTISTLPHFITWVVIAGIFIQLLSPNFGYINMVIRALGGTPVAFLHKASWFPWLFTFMRAWKQMGYGSIIYLAALSGVDPQLYEAAVIDGASRIKQTWHVTLPGIKNTILVLFVLSFSGVLDGMFEPIFVLRNDMIRSTAEVLDTYTYTLGILRGRFSLATTIGLFKASISMILLFTANFLSKKVTEDRRSIL